MRHAPYPRGMDRREFLFRAAAAAPLLLGGRPASASASGQSALALVTADTEAHVGIVSLASGRIVGRLTTHDGPRSIERGRARQVIVAHTVRGEISLLDGRPPRVRRVLGGFSQPRYTAMAPDGVHAYVTDSGHGEVATIDLRAGRVVHRLAVGSLARHVTIDPAGRTLWIALGSSANTIVVVDVSEPSRPRMKRRLAPAFLAHDVSLSPSGRRVWVTSGRTGKLMVYAAGGTRPVRVLDADTAPQHVSFGGGVAYVASGEGRSLRVYDLRDGHIRHEASVPLGSYNVQRGAGRVLTPSLASGRLTILDPQGRVRHEVHVAAAAHDACALV